MIQRSRNKENMIADFRTDNGNPFRDTCPSIHRPVAHRLNPVREELAASANSLKSINS